MLISVSTRVQRRPTSGSITCTNGPMRFHRTMKCCRPPAVVVPLLICPYPDVDEAIAADVAAADVPILVAGHLGPHPFVAEAMHARLYEAGLARAGRSGRISIVSAADGFVVGAAGDAECVVAERLISCVDDKSRSLSAALSLDFPNMLLSLLLLLVKLRLA